MFVRRYEWNLVLDEIKFLYDELSELSALVEFLVEKQEKASKPRKVASATHTTKKA